MFFTPGFNQEEKSIRERVLGEIRAGNLVPDSEAKRIADDLVSKAIKFCKSNGSYGHRANGPAILDDEKSGRLAGKPMGAILANIRDEGATDSDILWWFSVMPLEIYCLELLEDWMKTTAYLALVEEEAMRLGAAAQDTRVRASAMVRLREGLVVFGNQLEPAEMQPEDRNLHMCFMPRIYAQIRRAAFTKPPEARTMNAAVRQWLRSPSGRGVGG